LLPILQNCCTAYKLLDQQIKEVNACKNKVYGRMFSLGKLGSVDVYICVGGGLEL